MKIEGKLIDKNGRCAHYDSDFDTINIKFKCCGKYYACISCHQEIANHEVSLWKSSEFEEQAIHCGQCNHLMTIEYYLAKNSCINCKSIFNPACEKHYKLYFEIK